MCFLSCFFFLPSDGASWCPCDCSATTAASFLTWCVDLWWKTPPWWWCCDGGYCFASAAAAAAASEPAPFSSFEPPASEDEGWSRSLTCFSRSPCCCGEVAPPSDLTAAAAAMAKFSTLSGSSLGEDGTDEGLLPPPRGSTEIVTDLAPADDVMTWTIGELSDDEGPDDDVMTANRATTAEARVYSWEALIPPLPPHPPPPLPPRCSPGRRC
mmetsp:Transcript_4882/g.13894  ORF Transcript_4882/g.13894 Transcript_4882/m.13894 type:complete len:212 (+) Transcript_4882:2795-3430(+)